MDNMMLKKKQPLYKKIIILFKVFYVLVLSVVLLFFNSLNYDKYVINEGTTFINHWEDAKAYLVLEGDYSEIKTVDDSVIVKTYNRQDVLISEVRFYSSYQVTPTRYILKNSRMLNGNIKTVEFWVDTVTEIEFQVIDGNQKEAEIWVDTLEVFSIFLLQFIIAIPYYLILFIVEKILSKRQMEMKNNFL